ncbi:MAG: hypothetical protein MSG64_00015 [Pyrinomonadaceae bacterium MAG19_C2-C3]|nr:hypothetical protein [Pyrinomonadaceae bacterium MAG19_C2-C3]
MNSTNFTKRFYVASLVFIGLTTFVACGSRTTNNNATRENLIVVNAPTAGVVRRVIAREGLPAREGAMLLEISVETPADASNSAASNLNNAMSEAAERARQIANSRTRVDAATHNKERTAIEVARVESLVAAGQAPQSQLDAARAEFQRAQEQAQVPTVGVVVPTSRPSVAPEVESKIVVVRVPANGTMRVISVKTGDRVRVNQPLATLTVED